VSSSLGEFCARQTRRCASVADCPAALGLFPHALCDVERLPVREVVSTLHFKADLTLGLGAWRSIIWRISAALAVIASSASDEAIHSVVQLTRTPAPRGTAKEPIALHARL
jgi:hypothetical protein